MTPRKPRRRMAAGRRPQPAQAPTQPEPAQPPAKPETEPALTPEEQRYSEDVPTVGQSIRDRLPKNRAARWGVYLSPLWLVLLIYLGAGMCSSAPEAAADPDPAAAAPTTELALAPTVAPVPLPTVIPAVQRQYEQYRLAHFLYEYGYCFSTVRADADNPSEAVYMAPDIEAKVLDDLPGAVSELLLAYDDGRCREFTAHAQHPGRGKWLRLWAGRSGGG